MKEEERYEVEKRVRENKEKLIKKIRNKKRRNYKNIYKKLFLLKFIFFRVCVFKY